MSPTRGFAVELGAAITVLTVVIRRPVAMANRGKISRRPTLGVIGTGRRPKDTRQIIAEECEEGRPTGHEDADVYFDYVPQDGRTEIP